MVYRPVLVRTVALDPVRAEVAVDVSAWPLEPGDEVHGKLVGPQCRYSSTVEIAYPLRARPGGGHHILIPEPSLWTPETPFVYTGKIEWRRGPDRLHDARFVHGLLHFQRTPAGDRLNGRPIPLRVAETVDATEQALLEVRDAGFNAVRLARPDPATSELAARIGLFLVRNEPDSVSIDSFLVV